MQEEKARLLFLMPCGDQILGLPKIAWADAKAHRDGCSDCKAVSYTNSIDVYARRRVKRELPMPPVNSSGQPAVITKIMLHTGVIPPKKILNQIVYGVMQPDEKNPELWVADKW